MCFKTKGLFKCGKCPECLQDRRTSWSLRLIQESRHLRCFSALLTYNEDNVPRCSDGMSLCKRDVQLFLKRLRHEFPDNKIKYYIAGEYSPQKLRPHYHCLFFGFPSDLASHEIKTILQKTWRLGFIGSFSDWLRSDAQINYATNYIINLYEWKDDDKRVRPFNLISKGLAMDYDEDVYSKIERHHNPRKFGWKFNKETKSFDYFAPYHLDVETNELVFDNDFFRDVDTIKIQQTIFDRKKRVTKLGKVHSYRMPRVWRNKVFTYEERDALNILHAIKNYKLEEQYQEMYGDYDSTSDFPMWKQLKYAKWVQRKKSKKDKLLSDPEHYFL